MHIGSCVLDKVSDTEIFVRESSDRITCPVPVPKDRMSTRRIDPIQDTRIDRSIHDLALDAVQVFEVEEITSCAARSALLPKGAESASRAYNRLRKKNEPQHGHRPH